MHIAFGLVDFKEGFLDYDVTNNILIRRAFSLKSTKRVFKALPRNESNLALKFDVNCNINIPKTNSQ